MIYLDCVEMVAIARFFDAMVKEQVWIGFLLQG